MAVRLLTLTILTLGAFSRCQGQTVDMTLTANTTGAEVVDAVVDKIHAHCLFNNDRLFLRRLAYVETLDGTDPKTYRAGYDGGIWQVDESMLQATQSCSNIIKNNCDVIKNEFGIDWPTVTWSQLRIPLYSALGASLYMIQRLANVHVIPGDIAGQADIWSHYYHLNEPIKTFEDLAPQATEYTCNGELDLAFVMDSSGSILTTDYNLQLNFAANVVNSLPFDQNQTRVGSVSFGTKAVVNFMLHDYVDKNDIVQQLVSTPKDNGGTNTPDALELTRTVLFNETHGARPSAKQVAILLTDGESYNYSLTVIQARKLRDAGVTVFAIGVGFINIKELMAVASDPVCNHVYILDNYAHIDSILFEIQKSTCEAPKILTPERPVQGHVTLNTTIMTITTSRPDNNDTVLAIRSNCSVVDVFLSYSTPVPNAALFDEKYQVDENKPAFLSMSGTDFGEPVYLTLQATRLFNHTSGSSLASCLEFTYEAKFENQTKVDIVCREKSTYRDCHPQDFIGSSFEHLLCTANQRPIPNPCTVGNLGKGDLIFPHPYDINSFIKCDLLGQMYITLCPNNQLFNKGTLACGFDVSVGVEGGVALPGNYNNPCSPDTFQSGLYFFAFADNKHQYIQCDVWGGAWLKSCVFQHIWNDHAHTCVPDTLHEFDSTTFAPFEVVNPCTPQNLNSGIYFFPHPCDHTKYIHCDIAGNYYIQNCPTGQYFNPTTFNCSPGDAQQNNPQCRPGKK